MTNQNRSSFIGKFLVALLVIAPAVLCTQGIAQSPAAAPSTAPAADQPTTPKESIMVGPGDSLHVLVYDEQGLEQRVTVSDQGNAVFFLVGTLHVAGMTPSEVSRALEGLLGGHYLVHPNVNVTIEQSATMQVSVLGEVRAPGNFDIGTARNILDIISLAGGLTDAADRRITIQHGTGKTNMTTVFMPNNASEAIEGSALVYPGDTVIVPKAGIVYVLGDVNRPGGYYMQRDSQLSALQAIGMAGGLAMNAGAPSSRLVRKDKSAPNGYVNLPLQLRAIQNGKKEDVALQPDDVIYVPFSYARNFVMQSNAIIAAATSAIIYTHP